MKRYLCVVGMVIGVLLLASGAFAQCDGCGGFSHGGCGGYAIASSGCGGYTVMSAAPIGCGSYYGSYGSDCGCGTGTGNMRAPTNAAPLTPTPAPSLPPPPTTPKATTYLQPGRATITVQVPENAVVYINGRPTNSTGSSRIYVSLVEPGQRYRYWVQVGSDLRQVVLAVGQTSHFDFTQPAIPVEQPARYPSLLLTSK